MSVAAPWEDAPVVEDAEPWKSAPVVEDSAAPWEAAPIVEDEPAKAASPELQSIRDNLNAKPLFSDMTLKEAFEEPTLSIPKMDEEGSTAHQITAGVVNSVTQMAEGISSPKGVLAGGLLALGGIPAKIVGTVMGAEAVKATPDVVDAVAAAKTPYEIAASLTNAALNTSMILPAAHAVSRGKGGVLPGDVKGETRAAPEAVLKKDLESEIATVVPEEAAPTTDPKPIANESVTSRFGRTPWQTAEELSHYRESISGLHPSELLSEMLKTSESVPVPNKARGDERADWARDSFDAEKLKAIQGEWLRQGATKESGVEELRHVADALRNPDHAEALTGKFSKLKLAIEALQKTEQPPPVPPKEAPPSAPAAPEGVNEWTTATLPSLEAKGEPVAPEATATPVGILPPGSQQLTTIGAQLSAGAKKVVSAIKNIPAFHDFRRSILNWSARNQKSSGEIHKATTDITKAIPDPIRRAGITNWIQAGGDMALLQARGAGSKDLKLRQGYEAAMKLTPDELALAGKVRQTYDTLLQRANDHGIEISEIENYVNQIWKRQPLRDFAAGSNRKLSTSIRFAKKRYYDSFFEGEQAGLRPETKDISKLLPIYINEVNNAISAKQFVAEMAQGKAADGRPLLAPRGGAKTIDGEEGGKVHLVFPERASKDTGDYRVLEQPALHAWRWRGADEAGNPIMVQGDLAVHPEAYSHLKNVLGQSALREWYRSPSESIMGDIPKAAVKFLVDDVQQIAKATMLGFLSPFHQVQEGTHGIGHKVNPFRNIPKIDLSLPNQMDAAKHGLMLLPDRVSSQQFREGLDGSSRNLMSNLIGLAGKPGRTIKEWADGYQHYLFHEYIPGLKLKTYEHILERNSKRYEKEMAAGEVSIDQVKYLSAQQSNAAYGHLNYADIGRNPTIQHIAQAILLAPDFLEARTRFAGQAAKGAVSKAGREQAVAIATLAVTQFVLSRILNQLADGDPHWDHPFEVISGNRCYTMRSVPEDIYKAFKDSRKFITGRLSPLIGRGTLEGLSGVNYRGEPTDFSATISNILAGFVPLTIQPATRGLTETGRDNPVSPFEQLLGSLGMHVSRFSPVSEVYSLSKEWIEKHGKEYGLDKKRGVHPISEYQQLRYALDDADFDKAKAEIKSLTESKKISRGELVTRFGQAINHPFTGTVRTDREFEKSLDERGKKIFKAAKERRVLLLRRLRIALKP